MELPFYVQRVMSNFDYLFEGRNCHALSENGND